MVYILDRAARVYSVALPTLLLSFIFAVFFQNILDPHNDYTIKQLVIDSLLNLFFLGQSWNLKSWVYFNQPYWSLCYEVMYYLGFGIFIFWKGRMRLIGLTLIALISGPKVMLLLPCWVFGVCAYHIRDKTHLTQSKAILVGFIFPAVTLVLLHAIGFGPAARKFFIDLFGDQKDYLDFSSDFYIDYVTAILVAVNLYSARFIKWKFHWRANIIIKEGAAVSFTLYLMHLPIIFLIINLAGSSRNSNTIFWLIIVAVPLICYFIANYTEKRREKLRDLLKKLVSVR